MRKQTELEKKLQRQKDLLKTLKRRKVLLDKLEAQPEWVGYAAAFFGSIASTMVMHPVDTLKTRLIKSDTEDVENSGDSDPGLPVLTLESVPSLYSGLLGNIVKEGPSSALYLGVYESVKLRLVKLPVFPNPLVVYLIAGATGELFGSVIRAPAEAVKTRVQSGVSWV